MKIYFPAKLRKSSWEDQSDKESPGGRRNRVLNHLKDIPRRLQWTPRVKSFIHLFNADNVEKPYLCKSNFPL